MSNAVRSGRAVQAMALVATLAALSACTGSRPEIRPAAATGLPPVDLVDERTGRALGASPDAALNAAAGNTRAGTLLARSPDGRVCVFADGRGSWNRAAC